MSLRYLFPCPSCSQPIELSSKQAGQKVICPECQAESEAPKLGELRQFDSIEVPDYGRRSTQSGGLKSWLFVAGLGIAIVAGAGGGTLYYYATGMISPIDVDRGMKFFEEGVDETQDADVIALFEEMKIADGLPEWHEQPVVRYSNQGRILKTFSYGILGISGVGLLILAGSFLVRSNPRRD